MNKWTDPLSGVTFEIVVTNKGLKVTAINYNRGQVHADIDVHDYRSALHIYCALIDVYAR